MKKNVVPSYRSTSHTLFFGLGQRRLVGLRERVNVLEVSHVFGGLRY